MRASMTTSSQNTRKVYDSEPSSHTSLHGNSHLRIGPAALNTVAAFSAPVVSGYEENIFAWFAECYLRGCFALSLCLGRKRKICIFDRRPFLGKSHRSWATKLFPGHN